jgi:hypothetical protein
MMQKVKNNESLFQYTNAVARHRNAIWDLGSRDRSNILGNTTIVPECFAGSPLFYGLFYMGTGKFSSPLLEAISTALLRGLDIHRDIGGLVLVLSGFSPLRKPEAEGTVSYRIRKRLNVIVAVYRDEPQFALVRVLQII